NLPTFFFSSRRRHTRFSRDWSSDVCSSDRESPWPPFHVDQGYAPEDSTVLVVAAEAPHNVIDGGSTTALGVLGSMVDAMRSGGKIGRASCRERMWITRVGTLLHREKRR